MSASCIASMPRTAGMSFGLSISVFSVFTPWSWLRPFFLRATRSRSPSRKVSLAHSDLAWSGVRVLSKQTSCIQPRPRHPTSITGAALREQSTSMTTLPPHSEDKLSNRALDVEFDADAVREGPEGVPDVPLSPEPAFYTPILGRLKQSDESRLGKSSMSNLLWLCCPASGEACFFVTWRSYIFGA